MKISRRQLRKLIREEILLETPILPTAAAAAAVSGTAAISPAIAGPMVTGKAGVGLAVIAAPALILAAIVAAGLAATTVDAQDLFDKLDPEIQDKLRKTHDSLKSTLSYLGKDAVEDALAAVINKILVQK
jgi:hypothetical protein